MFVTLALAAAASAAPMPVMPMVGRFRCGNEDVTLTVRRGRAYLTVGRAQYSLAHVRSASGARYAARGIEFWEKGDMARLTVGKRAPTDCIVRTADDRLPYRARGQEPGWVLDLNPNPATRTATFSYDYGKKKAVEPLRAFVVMAGGAKQWGSVSGALTIVATPGGCTDTMSGQAYPDSVTVTYRKKSYRGCGGAVVTMEKAG